MKNQTSFYSTPIEFHSYHLYMEKSILCILESFLEKPSLSFSERHSLYSYENYSYTLIVRAILEETRRGKQRECYQTLFSFHSSYCRQYTVTCTTLQACIPVFQTFRAICQEVTLILSCCPSMQVLLTESRFFCCIALFLWYNYR